MDTRTREQKIECLVNATMTYMPGMASEDVVREKASSLSDYQLDRTLQGVESLDQDEVRALAAKYAPLTAEDKTANPAILRRKIKNHLASVINEYTHETLREIGVTLGLSTNNPDHIRQALLDTNEDLNNRASDESVYRTWKLLKAKGVV